MSAKLYCIFIKDDLPEVIINSQFNLREIYKEWLVQGEIKPCLLHIGFDRPTDEDLYNFLLNAKKYVFASPSFYYSFPEKIEFSKNIYYQLNNLELKVLLSGWFQNTINEEEIDIKKINKLGIITSLDETNIIDRKILTILSKYDINNYQEFLDQEKDSIDSQILKIRKEIFFSCRDLFFTFDDFLKIIPIWLKEKNISELIFSVRIENCFISNKVVKISDLSKFTKADLIEWKNFGKKSMFLFIDRIEELIQSRSPIIDSSILDKSHVNQFSEPQNKQSSFEYFYQWLFRMGKSESTIKKYGRSIEQISSYLKENGHIQSSLLDLPNVDDLKDKINIYFADKQNFTRNQIGNNMWSAAGNQFIEFFIHKEKNEESIDNEQNINNNLLDEFKNKMKSILSEREIEIITKRSYLSQTLEEIGSVRGITRERIRQIEKKGKAKIIKAYPEWYKQVIDKCDRLFDKYLDLNTPTDIKYIANSDHYFKNIDSQSGIFEYILENFLPKKYFLINFNGGQFLAKVKQDQFDKIINSLKSNFKNNDKTSFENFIDKELSLYSLSTMKDLIIEQFNSDFVTYKNRLIELLEEKGKPTHYEELCELYNEKFNDNVKSRDIQSKLNLYTNVFFCYSRGVWGLKQHLNIDENEQIRITNLIENFILNNPNDEYYQWSSEDLVSQNKLNINDYELSIILLNHAKKIHYLGRNVWSLTKSDRLEFFDLAIQILETTARPMTLSEIKEKISKRRSTSLGQIHIKFPLTLIQQGFYGLETFTSEQKMVTSEQKMVAFEQKKKFKPLRNRRPDIVGWNINFDLLSEYYTEHKNTISIVNTTIYKDFKIGNWVGRQKRLYHKNKLLKERTIKLETSFHDWKWKSQKKNVANINGWNNYFEVLTDYYSEYENTTSLVNSTVHKEVKIGNWVGRQKRLYHKNELLKERTIKLETSFHDWKWETERGIGKYKIWYERFELLKQYLNEKNIHSVNTTANVSVFKGIDLGRWVSKQRSEYAKNNLPSEKISKLDSLDFWEWKVGGSSSWDEKLKVLQEYYNKFKTLKVKRGRRYKNIDLAIWVSNQKQNFLNNNLSKDRIDRIETAFPEWVWAPNNLNSNKN